MFYKWTENKLELNDNGNSAWNNGNWHISDGKQETSLSKEWKKAVLFNSLNA